MRVLVLGGTHFVGRGVVEAALRRGDDVTTVTRGASGPPVPGAQAVYADRTEAGALRQALDGLAGEWDAVVDTWSGAPRVVAEAADLLADRAGGYGYVSSRSVYQWPLPVGADESAPVVGGDPGSGDAGDYAAAKRGGELAAMEAFGHRALLARAGLVLGPHEDVGRLPWWLRRLHSGGPTVAPGPRDRPLQYIDARDLAEWMLAALQRGLGGPFNAVSHPGHTTTEELLSTCAAVTGGTAELVWVSPTTLAAAGVQGWVDLPIWTPPDGELAGLHGADVSAAHAEGLRCRPVGETVADTWTWLRAQGALEPPAGRAQVGLAADVEQRLLAGG